MSVAPSLFEILSYWLATGFLLSGASCTTHRPLPSVVKISFALASAAILFVAFSEGITRVAGPIFFLILLSVFMKSFSLSVLKSSQKMEEAISVKEEDLKKEKELLEKAQMELSDLSGRFEKITANFSAARQTLVCINIRELCQNILKTILGYPRVLSVAVFDDKFNCLSSAARNKEDCPSEKLKQAAMNSFPSEKRAMDICVSESDGGGILIYPFAPVHGARSGRVMGICVVEFEKEQRAALGKAGESNGLTDIKKFLAENILSVFSLGFVRASLFEEYEIKSRYDSLTGLFNRRYFMDKLLMEIHRVARYGGSFGIFMVDIDHFKEINDTYGHPVGDEALVHLSKILTKEISCRYPGLFWGRYGGEEFVGCMPLLSGGNDKEHEKNLLIKIAEDVRRTIAEKTLVSAKGKSDNKMTQLKITASIGVAVFPSDGNTADKIIASADSALYEAKSAGRNRVTFFNKDKKV